MAHLHSAIQVVCGSTVIKAFYSVDPSALEYAFLKRVSQTVLIPHLKSK